MRTSLRKVLIATSLMMVFMLQFSTVYGQVCTECFGDELNCGANNCDFACEICSDVLPPSPDVPVNNGIGILIAAGMGLAGLVFYRKVMKQATEIS